MSIGEIFSFFLLFIIVLAVFFGVYLYKKNAFKHRADRVLKFFLILILIHVIYIIFRRYLLFNDFFLGDATPFSLLYVPLYFHVLYLLRYNTKSKYIILHFVPAFILWMFFFILLINKELSMLYYLLYKKMVYGTFAFLLLYYSIYGYLLFSKGIGKIINRRYMEFIIVSSLIMIVISVFYIIKLFKNDDFSIIPLSFSFFEHVLLFVFVLSINRMWYYRIVDEKEDKNNLTEDESDKYCKSRIKDSRLEESIKELERMEIQFYLDADLNLEKLSAHLRISKYELSQVFSIGLKTSFAKYINSKRCHYASKLLLERKDSNYSIENIALQSGYSSNVTFYRAFKEIYGVAPSKYN